MRFTFVLVSLAFTCAGDTVLRTVNRPGMRQKGIVVDSGTFNPAHVERLSRAELASKPRTRFIQLLVYGEKGGAPLPKPSHLTYEHWRGLHNSLVRSPSEIAEMISIGNDSVLRTHDSSGSIGRRVLSGRDPLKLEVQGVHFEIVYLAFSAPGSHTLQRADIFIRTDSDLKIEIGICLLGQLQPIFHGMELFLAIRKDTWFITEPSYPISNPFIQESDPPTTQELSRTRTLKCGRWSGAATCRLE